MSEVGFEIPTSTTDMSWVVRYGQAAVPRTTQGLVPDIRSSDREALVRKVAQRADEGWIPDAPEAEALLCRITADQYFGRTGKVVKRLPWPGGETYLPYGHMPHSYIQNSDHGEAPVDRLLDIFEEVVPHMDKRDRVKLAAFALKHQRPLYQYSRYQDYGFIARIFHGIDVAAPGADKLADLMLDIFQNEVDESTIAASDRFAGHVARKTELRRALLWNGSDLLFRAIAKHRDTIDVKKFLGLITRDMSITAQINDLRAFTVDPGIPDSDKEGHQSILRTLLGLPEGTPIHPSLEALYASIKFEHYPVSERTRQGRVDMLEDVLKKYHIGPTKRILDLGTGTGWLTDDLRSSHPRVIGVDASARNIQTARKLYPRLSGHFRMADWYDLPADLHGQDAILSLGRSLPHTEDRNHFQDVIKEVRGALLENGLFVFDMPDPRVGSYATNVASYRSVLRNLGYTEKELEDIWYVVDSPDGKNFYNRYVPPKEAIIGLLRHAGFAIEEVIDEELPNGHDDRNLVFVCRKVPDKVREAWFKRAKNFRIWKYESHKGNRSQGSNHLHYGDSPYGSDVSPRELEPRTERRGNDGLVDDDAKKP